MQPAPPMPASFATRQLMPVGVESVILNSPLVLDCRVRGEANALVSRAVVADVVAAPAADHEQLRAAIWNACRRALAAHKVPTRVNFVGSVSGERLKKQRLISRAKPR